MLCARARARAIALEFAPRCRQPCPRPMVSEPSRSTVRSCPSTGETKHHEMLVPPPTPVCTYMIGLLEAARLLSVNVNRPWAGRFGFSTATAYQNSSPVQAY